MNMFIKLTPPKHNQQKKVLWLNQQTQRFGKMGAKDKLKHKKLKRYDKF